MPATTVLIAVAAAVVLGAVVAVLLARRDGSGSSAPDLPQAPGGAGERTSKVRVLPSAENAREARTQALTAEMESLQREAQYAEKRGLDRRAQRLRAMIEDRRRQLESRGDTGRR